MTHMHIRLCKKYLAVWNLGVKCSSGLYITTIEIFFSFLLEDQYERDTLIIPVDFSSGYEIYGGLASQLQGLDIGILGQLYIIMLKTPSSCGQLMHVL